ncbi:MAG: hypothetical protein JXR83_17775 [Deltaproteobacteria bacterium]|nr:hypothetical protein [Deltaproteobacteria bacterium]
MVGLTLFGVLLLVVSSTGSALVLSTLLLLLALLVLGLSVPLRDQLSDRVRRLSDRLGIAGGAVTAAALLYGLSFEPQAYVADGGVQRLLLFVASALAVAGLSGITGVALAAVGAHGRRWLSWRPIAPAAGSGKPDAELDRARTALIGLRDAVDKLRAIESEAKSRADRSDDDAVAAEYRRTAAAIGEKLELSEELLATAARGVVRLACRAALRRVVHARPDAAIAAVSAETRPDRMRARVKTALRQLAVYLDRLGAARWRVEDEVTASAGSIAHEFGVAASADGLPEQEVLDEMLRGYERARHQLEALELRLSAEVGAEAAVRAANTLAQGDPLVEAGDIDVAVAIASVESTAQRALEVAAFDSTALTQAVCSAAALVGSGRDQTHLRDLLQALREATAAATVRLPPRS